MNAHHPFAAHTFDPIETPRLRLRRFAERDLPTLLAYRNDPAVSRYQSWESMSEEQGRLLIAEMEGNRPGLPGDWFQFAIEEREGGAHIGDCALHTRADDVRLGEIGYTLASGHQGRGYGREAVTALLDYAFGALSMHRITATVDVENLPSIRLLEALGFRREGHFRQCGWFHGRWCDEYLYAMLRADWIGRTGQPALAQAEESEAHR